MNETAIQAHLQRIEAEWGSLGPTVSGDTSEPPPWGVWIRLFAPLPPDADSIGYTYDEMLSRLQAVWFLDEQGLRTQSVWAYHRFVTVHHRQLWCNRLFECSLPTGKIYHQIAEATIAPYQNSSDWYMDYQWGSRYGLGGRLVMDDNGAIHGRDRLWVS